MVEERKLIIDHFHQVVNMSPHQLSNWLKTEDSQAVGQKNGEDESIGHQSGRQIVGLLERDKSDYTEEEIAHMRKVVSYVRRHSAQRFLLSSAGGTTHKEPMDMGVMYQHGFQDLDGHLLEIFSMDESAIEQTTLYEKKLFCLYGLINLKNLNFV